MTIFQNANGKSAFFVLQFLHPDSNARHRKKGNDIFKQLIWQHKLYVNLGKVLHAGQPVEMEVNNDIQTYINEPP